MNVSYRGRRDTQLATSFFPGRVNFPTEQECEKLRRVIRHIIDSMDEPLFLGATNMDILVNFIDASYGVHNDFKNHTGSTTTFGFFHPCHQNKS